MIRNVEKEEKYVHYVFVCKISHIRICLLFDEDPREVEPDNLDETKREQMKQIIFDLLRVLRIAARHNLRLWYQTHLSTQLAT